MRTLEQIYFPENAKRSAHYAIGRVTGFCNGIWAVRALFTVWIAVLAVWNAAVLSLQVNNAKGFAEEVKDNLVWGVSLYQVQYRMAVQYYQIIRGMDAEGLESYLKTAEQIDAALIANGESI